MKKLIVISLIVLISATSVYALSNGLNKKQIRFTDNVSAVEMNRTIETHNLSNFPEPSLMILLGTALIGFASVQRRKVIK